MKVATAGNPIVDVTDLNVTGTIVTGVLTSFASSEVTAVCLQDKETVIIAESRQKKK
jgi:hypothetical protein